MSASMTSKGHNLPKPAHACFRVEYVSGQGYAVIAPDGRVALAPTGRDIADAKRDRLQAALDMQRKIGPRPCLCCGAVFDSAGIHNRLCTTCRGRSDALAAYGYVGAGDGRKPRRSAGA